MSSWNACSPSSVLSRPTTIRSWPFSASAATASAFGFCSTIVVMSILVSDFSSSRLESSLRPATICTVSPISLAFSFACSTALLLGRFLLERGGEEVALLRALSGGVVVTLGAIMLGLRRFAVQGSFAQYHGDFGTQPLAGSSLGYAILLLGFWLTAGLAFAVWNLRRLD